MVAFMLKCLFQALTLLHEECHVVHTDIKEDNIILEADPSVLAQFEDEQLKQPSPVKKVDGSVIHVTRDLGTPKAFECAAQFRLK